jgi:uncharacterized protein YlxW (UPF0749 family)
MRIQVSDFNFKSKPGSTETGFIAQQLYTVLPEVVTQGGTDPSTDPWMVDYGRVTPLLTKAIQELKQETDSKEASLDKENSELKASVAEQDKKIAALNGANVGLKAEVAQLKASNEKLAAMAAEMEALKKTVTSIQRKENGAMRAVSLEQQ